MIINDTYVSYSCSTSQRDESAGDVGSNNVDAIASKVPNISDKPAVDNTPIVNGALNSAAFTSNASIDSPVESQAAESASSLPALPDLPAPVPTKMPSDENNINLSEQLPVTSADAALEAAIEEPSMTSTVPPVVDAQESDLRHVEPSSTDAPINDLEQANITPKIDLNQSTDSATLSTLEPQDEPASALADSATDLSTQEAPASIDLPVKGETDQEPSNADGLGGQDTEMTDVPQIPQPTKVPREREDDEDAERSVKRTKTEDESNASVVNGVPASTQNGEHDASAEPAVTPYLIKEIIKQVKNAARTADGKNLRAPVVELWPALAAAYEAKVPTPTDFATIEKNLRDNKYPTMKEVKADIELLYTNCVLFNGPEHDITKAAQRASNALLAKIANIAPEPVPVPKKENKKAKAVTPAVDYTPKPRRQSKGTAAESAPAQTFALDPQSNTPLIRRDSTKAETGRPKRDIIPPKNKDLSYSVRPKSKKYAVELRWCREVLTELKKPKYNTFSYPFQQPVDPVALGIPTYFSVIKHPMDISTVDQNLSDDLYSTSKEFEKDVGLIFSNAFKFNPPGNPVHELAKQYEALWKEQLSKKSRWISDHTPAVASASPTPDSEAEESENEPEQPANIGESAVFKRLVEEQSKLIALLSDPASSAVDKKIQQDMVDFLKNQVDAEKNKAAPAKKSKKAQTTKSAAPKKKAAPPAKAPASKKQKQRYLGTLEKEVISHGIGSLPEDVAEEVLGLIQADRPDVGVSFVLHSSVCLYYANHFITD